MGVIVFLIGVASENVTDEACGLVAARLDAAEAQAIRRRTVRAPQERYPFR
ncbi:MAG TPA: hypothetical protein VFY65_15175 [Longimicrobium sp.]|nr:hypothetical protein [Longimicrobium sp.]